jgi:hypothetical protein
MLSGQGPGPTDQTLTTGQGRYALAEHGNGSDTQCSGRGFGDVFGTQRFPL